MINEAWNDKRRLVPRWRRLDQTARAGELSCTRRTASGRSTWSLSPEHTERLRQWRLGPSLVTAAELVESAIVEGKEDMAVAAARRIVFHEPNAVPLVRRQARDLLERTGHARELPDEPVKDDFRPVAHWRGRVRLNPADALAWVELSLSHTIQGNLKHAHRDMRIAMQLAPDNRHVLRSAARLLLHLGRPDEAHDLLLRSPATKGDPWLLAAEISIAEVSARSPKFAKSGRALLESGGILPRQTTELAGALATLDMVDGAHKRSRKLFAKSMIDPTGNALAQAEWATPFAGARLVPAARLDSVQEASEARAFHAYMVQDFEAVAPACEMWATEEPYSIRPFEFGATVAGFAEEYDVAIALAQRGLSMRPGAPKLVNSLVFCLASVGRLDEAERELDAFNWSVEDESSQHVAAANRGLLAFRRGASEEGRAHYKSALEGFQRLGDRGLAAEAKAYLAREESFAGQESAAMAIEEARKTWTQLYGKRIHPALVAAVDNMTRRRSRSTEQPTWSARAVISYGAGTNPHRLAPVQHGGADEDRS
jgi:tetratricopeptide (TPR) repeat protein